MSLLEHPEAQALLNDATVSPDTVRGCTDRLTGFLQRYLPKFYRAEQRENATTVIRGRRRSYPEIGRSVYKLSPENTANQGMDFVSTERFMSSFAEW